MSNTKTKNQRLLSILHDKTKPVRINRKKIVVSLSSISFFLFFMATPAFAYEDDAHFWEVGDKIHNQVATWLLDFAQMLFRGYLSMLEASSSTSYISGKFSTLFGSETVYSLVASVHGSAIVPLAESILALFMLVQLVKISQKVDANATLPTVKEIVFLAVMYVIFHWTIQHSLEITTAIFDEINKIVTSFNGNDSVTASQYMDAALDWSELKLEDVKIGNCFLLIIMALFSYLSGFIGFIIALLMSMARALQLYVFASFSPLPVSLLGFEETRQMGIGFFKNFCAVCLAGAIMMFLFLAYPAILTSSISTLGSSDLTSMITSDLTDSGVTVILALATWLTCTILFCMGLIKSGAWAKELLGN